MEELRRKALESMKINREKNREEGEIISDEESHAPASSSPKISAAPRSSTTAPESSSAVSSSPSVPELKVEHQDPVHSPLSEPSGLSASSGAINGTDHKQNGNALNPMYVSNRTSKQEKPNEYLDETRQNGAPRPSVPLPEEVVGARPPDPYYAAYAAQPHIPHSHHQSNASPMVPPPPAPLKHEFTPVKQEPVISSPPSGRKKDAGVAPKVENNAKLTSPQQNKKKDAKAKPKVKKANPNSGKNLNFEQLLKQHNDQKDRERRRKEEEARAEERRILAEEKERKRKEEEAIREKEWEQRRIRKEEEYQRQKEAERLESIRREEKYRRELERMRQERLARINEPVPQNVVPPEVSNDMEPQISLDQAYSILSMFNQAMHAPVAPPAPEAPLIGLTNYDQNTLLANALLQNTLTNLLSASGNLQVAAMDQGDVANANNEAMPPSSPLSPTRSPDRRDSSERPDREYSERRSRESSRERSGTATGAEPARETPLEDQVEKDLDFFLSSYSRNQKEQQQQQKERPKVAPPKKSTSNAPRTSAAPKPKPREEPKKPARPTNPLIIHADQLEDSDSESEHSDPKSEITGPKSAKRKEPPSKDPKEVERIQEIERLKEIIRQKEQRKKQKTDTSDADRRPQQASPPVSGTASPTPPISVSTAPAQIAQAPTSISANSIAEELRYIKSTLGKLESRKISQEKEILKRTEVVAKLRSSQEELTARRDAAAVRIRILKEQLRVSEEVLAHAQAERENTTKKLENEERETRAVKRLYKKTCEDIVDRRWRVADLDIELRVAQETNASSNASTASSNIAPPNSASASSNITPPESTSDVNLSTKVSPPVSRPQSAESRKPASSNSMSIEALRAAVVNSAKNRISRPSEPIVPDRSAAIPQEVAATVSDMEVDKPASSTSPSTSAPAPVLLEPQATPASTNESSVSSEIEPAPVDETPTYEPMDEEFAPETNGYAESEPRPAEPEPRSADAEEGRASSSREGSRQLVSVKEEPTSKPSTTSVSSVKSPRTKKKELKEKEALLEKKLQQSRKQISNASSNSASSNKTSASVTSARSQTRRPSDSTTAKASAEKEVAPAPVSVPAYVAAIGESPLLAMRSYRLNPHFGKDRHLSVRSATFSNRIDPNVPICYWELSGRCNDSQCKNQHVRDYMISEEDVLRDLASYKNYRDSKDKKVVNDYLSRLMRSADPLNEKVQKLITDLNLVQPSESGEEGHSILLQPRPEHAKRPFRAPVQASSDLDADDTDPRSRRRSLFEILAESQGTESEFIHLYEDERAFAEESLPKRYWKVDTEPATYDEMLRREENFHKVDLWIKCALQHIPASSRMISLKNRDAALTVLARALEKNRQSPYLWRVYLHFYAPRASNSDLIGLLNSAVKFNETSLDLWIFYVKSETTLKGKIAICNSAINNYMHSGTAQNRSAVILHLIELVVQLQVDAGHISDAIVFMQNQIPGWGKQTPVSRLSDSDFCIFLIRYVYLLAFKNYPTQATLKLKSVTFPYLLIRWDRWRPSAHDKKIVEEAFDQSFKQYLSSDRKLENLMPLCANQIDMHAQRGETDVARLLCQNFVKVDPNLAHAWRLYADYEESVIDSSTFQGNYSLDIYRTFFANRDENFFLRNGYLKYLLRLGYTEEAKAVLITSVARMVKPEGLPSSLADFVQLSEFAGVSVISDEIASAKHVYRVLLKLSSDDIPLKEAAKNLSPLEEFYLLQNYCEFLKLTDPESLGEFYSNALVRLRDQPRFGLVLLDRWIDHEISASSPPFKILELVFRSYKDCDLSVGDTFAENAADHMIRSYRIRDYDSQNAIMEKYARYIEFLEKSGKLENLDRVKHLREIYRKLCDSYPDNLELAIKFAEFERSLQNYTRGYEIMRIFLAENLDTAPAWERVLQWKKDENADKKEIVDLCRSATTACPFVKSLWTEFTSIYTRTSDEHERISKHARNILGQEVLQGGS
eukprot:TRINITY_DN1880_c0_g1_i1.p1 TRINITY_DN1880_c0_g1~~TRINITY_DN1880_c0_g1_i1.p1  ORF type:complete len:1959 (-),score=491.78 TRINITY_DN1880_c0_g1_i1:489-6365(-)